MLLVKLLVISTLVNIYSSVGGAPLRAGQIPAFQTELAVGGEAGGAMARTACAARSL